jgi:hypothetical protein
MATKPRRPTPTVSGSAAFASAALKTSLHDVTDIQPGSAEDDPTAPQPESFAFGTDSPASRSDPVAITIPTKEPQPGTHAQPGKTS